MESVNGVRARLDEVSNELNLQESDGEAFGNAIKKDLDEKMLVLIQEHLEHDNNATQLRTAIKKLGAATKKVGECCRKLQKPAQ